MKEIRCNGCGKVIAPESTVIRIVFGTLGTKGKFEEQREWGFLDKVCFDRYLSDPKEFLSTLKSSVDIP
jgi:hypothetical protein